MMKMILIFYTTKELKNILNPKSNPIDEWKEMEKSFLRPSYNQVIRDNIISSNISYLSWLENNNFGVPTNLEPHKDECCVNIAIPCFKINCFREF